MNEPFIRNCLVVARRLAEPVAMGIAVRRVDAGDGPLLAQLRLAALADTPSAFASTYEVEGGLGPEDWTSRARRGASGADGATWFAFYGGEPVGLVGGYRAEPAAETVELVSMWVAPEARRHGAARALVDAVVHWATETGARSVDLWVTRGNDAARVLYERSGFAATGDHKPLPSDPCKDEQRMTLQLGSTPRT